MTDLTPPSALPSIGPSRRRNGSEGFGEGRQRQSSQDGRQQSSFGKSRPSWYVPVVSVASTMLVVGIASYFIWQSNSRQLVEQQFFNREKFWDSFPDVVGGFWLNIQMFVVAEIAILLVALLVAVMRSLRGPEFFPLRVLSVIYIDIFRGFPLLLLILLLGFGVPTLGISYVPNGVLFWGVTALVLSYSAYTAEVYRSGIESVSESQRSSARSLGLTQGQAMRYAILPQAVRNVIPALLNGLVSLQKDVALVSVLGIRESVRVAEIEVARSFNFTPYMVAAVLFLLISIPLARVADWYTKRDRERRTQTHV